MDRALIPRRQRRAPFGRFLLWLLPWCLLLAAGIYAGARILVRGLNQTAMDNRFAFGLWIFVDLAIIALGAGAFFTGFLLYLARRREFKTIINSAVVLGFICYSGAVSLLMLDVGQPLRAWFTFWHPNVHSMLTEVTFCITCYLGVLSLEYLPLVLRHRRLRERPALGALEFHLHHLMPVLAAVGMFLSFFHQGSLGGLYGVLRGRPFAFREGFALWPSTFFLFILSAAAVGPSFLLVTTGIVSRLSRRRLVPAEVLERLGRISGWMLLLYVLGKGLDTLLWLNRTASARGVHPYGFYAWPPFGTWILFAEVILGGLVPALILHNRRLVRKEGWRIGAAGLACAGVMLNRLVMTLQTLSLPTLAFDPFRTYLPSWQEVASLGGVVAYGVLLYSLSFRYLPLFPSERELESDTGAR